MPLSYRLRLVLSYSIDWTLAFAIAIFAQFVLNKFQQIPEFDLTDPSIQFPFHETQTVPKALFVVLLAIPYLSVVGGNLLFNLKNWWDLHVALLALTLSYCISGTFVQVVRISIGSPRPDFLARCNPLPGSSNVPVFGLSNVTICQTPITNPDMIDGVRSFFSGHAILSAAGFGFVSLYWGAKMRLFDHKPRTWKLWIVVIPIGVSIWICLTRVANRRHHPRDVIAGFFSGLIIVYAVYRQFYPPLSDTACNLPYGPRVANQESLGRFPVEDRPWLSAAQRDRASSRARELLESDLESSGFMSTPLHLEAQYPFKGTSSTESYPLQERP